MRTSRAICILLALAMVLALLPCSVLADDSTTTFQTVYKDLSPNTEIYALTQTPGPDYPNFGAKWEPTGGVLYGRTAKGGVMSNGRYGLANMDQAWNESIISYYYGTNDLTSQYDLEYWSYIYGMALSSGRHCLLVYLNFDHEGSDCATITSGAYDSRLTSDLTYLSTLSCPVFLRIGGEMNVWTVKATPADFIAAYRHIADLARTYAPNVALVFSPNFSGASKVDMDSFYPGDSYVDWVGCSLYYNRYNLALTGQDAFLGVGEYGDPMLNVQQTVNLSKLHKKPVMITEGGSSNKFNGEDNSEWAADKLAKAMSYLSMVYPQIKAIIHSDYGTAYESTDYTFYNNAVVSAAYDKAVERNQTLLYRYDESDPRYYTRLSAITGNWTGEMQLAAYTWSSTKLTANWFLDGKWQTTALDYPYTFTVNADKLTPGSHTVEVKFSNGATKAYTFQVKCATATPTNDALYVNGVKQTPSIYKIDGSNYFKLRDVAALLNGTGKQFSVGYDNATASVTVTTGEAYTSVGGELSGAATGGSATATVSTDAIYINGIRAFVTVYKINGSNYFKLRDLGSSQLDFSVGYENGSVIISTNKGYYE